MHSAEDLNVQLRLCCVCRYFVWADSTARGPFMPSYVKEPWHTHLTAPLSATLKLFGGTISCAGLKTGDARGWLQTPHVQVSQQRSKLLHRQVAARARARSRQPVRTV